jgi:hypothetical protein
MHRVVGVAYRCLLPTGIASLMLFGDTRLQTRYCGVAQF